MTVLCDHPERDIVVELLNSIGWNLNSETKKVLRFSQGSFELNFNGESKTKFAFILDPVLAGANIESVLRVDALIEDRFSSNFSNFPKKISKENKKQHFGVSLKFDELEQAKTFLIQLQLPELVA
ncbi:hypothetical protein [Hirschia baltica]|uniref:Uncharacterized protein n=1 Tax=Hirschia baltica (strain ATCC 49814 / DSM 5838 / IFAM 1418) TaxID=582402 RepID=C6XRB4_HIRBI|nr:hypothetical protein [Hirschia baltica]ACT58746.1 hypothetical protein Hbal_1052 [Hirschia baltica ATCC 49814]